MKKLLEGSLQRTIIEYLRLRRIFHYRQNTGAFKTERGGFYRFGVSGAPDIVVVVNGRYIGLEVKMGRNKQSIAQKKFQQELEQAGGLYWLVHSLEDVIEKLK